MNVLEAFNELDRINEAVNEIDVTSEEYHIYKNLQAELSDKLNIFYELFKEKAKSIGLKLGVSSGILPDGTIVNSTGGMHLALFYDVMNAIPDNVKQIIDKYVYEIFKLPAYHAVDIDGDPDLDNAKSAIDYMVEHVLEMTRVNSAFDHGLVVFPANPKMTEAQMRSFRDGIHMCQDASKSVPDQRKREIIVLKSNSTFSAGVGNKSYDIRTNDLLNDLEKINNA